MDSKTNQLSIAQQTLYAIANYIMQKNGKLFRHGGYIAEMMLVDTWSSWDWPQSSATGEHRSLRVLVSFNVRHDRKVVREYRDVGSIFVTSTKISYSPYRHNHIKIHDYGSRRPQCLIDRIDIPLEVPDAVEKFDKLIRRVAKYIISYGVEGCYDKLLSDINK